LEKFVHLKCRLGNLKPSVVVVIATVRALKMHGGGPPVVAGTPLSHVYSLEDLSLVNKGCANLERHIRHASLYGVPVVVCCNRFSSDSEAELEMVCSRARSAGAFEAVVSNHWEEGGKGAADLARAVIAASETATQSSNFQFLYSDDLSLVDKVKVISERVYGASGVDFSEDALKDLARYEEGGFGRLPICIAKTQYSLSADPELKNAPVDFRIPVREVRLSAGAGFVLVLCGAIQTMPGLPTRPAYFDIDVDVESGRVVGLM
jgi:formyltetrahydrofolate synthetase